MAYNIYLLYVVQSARSFTDWLPQLDVIVYATGGQHWAEEGGGGGGGEEGGWGCTHIRLLLHIAQFYMHTAYYKVALASQCDTKAVMVQASITHV